MPHIVGCAKQPKRKVFMRYLNLNILVAVNETDVNMGSRMALMVINVPETIEYFWSSCCATDKFHYSDQ